MVFITNFPMDSLPKANPNAGRLLPLLEWASTCLPYKCHILVFKVLFMFLFFFSIFKQTQTTFFPLDVLKHLQHRKPKISKHILEHKASVNIWEFLYKTEVSKDLQNMVF